MLLRFGLAVVRETFEEPRAVVETHLEGIVHRERVATTAVLAIAKRVYDVSPLLGIVVSEDELSGESLVELARGDVFGVQ